MSFKLRASYSVMVMRYDFYAYGFRFESYLADFRFVFFLSTFVLFFSLLKADVLRLRASVRLGIG